MSAATFVHNHAPCATRAGITSPRRPQIPQATFSTGSVAAHPSSTGNSQRCRSSDPQTGPFKVNHMGRTKAELERISADLDTAASVLVRAVAGDPDFQLDNVDLVWSLLELLDAAGRRATALARTQPTDP